MKGLVRY